MKEQIKKIISYILGITIFITSTKLEFKGILNKDKTENHKNDYTTEDYINNETTEEIQIETKSFIIETTEAPNETKEDITPTDEVIETSPPKPTNQLVSPTTNVLIRSSNTTESLKIGKLNINETAIKLLSYDNDWTLIKSNNHIGFVCNDYLKFTNDYIETEYKHIKTKDIAITQTNIDLKTEPNNDSTTIKNINLYTELNVIAEVNNEWLLIKHNGDFGYVNKENTISLLELKNRIYPQLNTSELNIQKVVYATTGLNIRVGNSTDYETIGYLEKYESVRVLNEYDDWYFIMTNDYQFGFISKNHTKELTGIYVIVDINMQTLYLYNNNELYFTTPVTTGKDSTPSDIGSFEIWYRGTDEEIVPGYHTNHWMPFNNSMEGLHDAQNREVFGIQYCEVYVNEINQIIPVISPLNYKTDYKIYGSNGCINMPPSISGNIFEYAELGTKVLVHK